MSRTRMAAYAAAVLLTLTACGTPAAGHRAPRPAVVEQLPTPTCAAGITSITPPEPDLSGDRDGDGINDIRPIPATC
ncbi:hypothetical protein [Streptosporangium sp. NPDC003464]